MYNGDKRFSLEDKALISTPEFNRNLMKLKPFNMQPIQSKRSPTEIDNTYF